MKSLLTPIWNNTTPRCVRHTRQTDDVAYGPLMDWLEAALSASVYKAFAKLLIGEAVAQATRSQM